jgi:hypothetical protein
MIDAQQPYMPVCLMSAAVLGTQYEVYLPVIREFRDKVLFEDLRYVGGFFSKIYYGFSGRVSGAVCRNKFLKYLVAHLIVLPAALMSKIALKLRR